jgi:hypothetical protein
VPLKLIEEKEARLQGHRISTIPAALFGLGKTKMGSEG